jgi:hypothetical protein
MAGMRDRPPVRLHICQAGIDDERHRELETGMERRARK